MSGPSLSRSGAYRVLFVLVGLFCLTPWASPPLALALGAALALAGGNPFLERTRWLAGTLLQASVVGLGFGLPLGAVVAAGAAGLSYTIAGILTALALGMVLGRWLGVDNRTAFLITAGTSICGGSAIAAVGPVIRAGPRPMSVALATVFLLNAAALFLFPPIGGALGLGQEPFAIWAAVAIHDTSSVVGAAAAYGPAALETATVLKLARALWIVPLAIGTGLYMRLRRDDGATRSERRSHMKLPWFIGLFLLAVVVRTLAEQPAIDVMESLAEVGRHGLVGALFLIGTGLTRESLRAIGVRPFAQGLLLWAILAGFTLGLVLWRGA